MTDMLYKMIVSFFSKIPDEDFDARLKEIGIEEDNIKKLKEMIGYNSVTKKEEVSNNKS